jgi:chromosome segregation ATPase
MDGDSTKGLPNEGDKYDTQPGITAVLERINSLDEKLEQRFAQLDEKWEKRFAAFEAKQEARHGEILAQLRKLTQQFELLAIDVTTARAELRDHRLRIEQIEERLPTLK